MGVIGPNGAGKTTLFRMITGQESADSGTLTVGSTDSPSRSEPPSGYSSPTIMRNNVVLPAPLGPITPTIPAGGSVNERSSIRRRSP